MEGLDYPGFMTGSKRNSELKRSLSGISQKVLTASLKSMIKDGLVERIDLKKIHPMSNIN